MPSETSTERDVREKLERELSLAQSIKDLANELKQNREETKNLREELQSHRTIIFGGTGEKELGLAARMALQEDRMNFTQKVLWGCIGAVGLSVLEAIFNFGTHLLTK